MLAILKEFSTWRPNAWVLTPEAMLAILKEFSTWRPNVVIAKTFAIQKPTEPSKI